MDNALYKNDSDYARDYAVTLSHDDFMGTEKSLSGIRKVATMSSRCERNLLGDSRLTVQS